MKSNVRFVVIWAAVMPVITGALLLVSPIGVATWSDVQTGLAITEANALSALVLAGVAYFWAGTVSEPAALQGATSVAAIATLALGNGFGWWNLSDDVGQLVTALVLAVLVLVLTFLNRQVAYAPETVDHAVAVAAAEAVTPQALMAAFEPKVVPTP